MNDHEQHGPNYRPSRSEQPMPSWRASLEKHLADDPLHDQISPEQAKRAERRRNREVFAKETARVALDVLTDVLFSWF